MDKKPSHQPPKFHPAHHPPPPMVPRQILPTSINPAGTSQHHPSIRPSPPVPHPTAASGISAFELNYATLPSFAQLQTSHGGPSPFAINSPPHSPSSLAPETPPQPPPQKLISEQARIRRDRMMKRGRTLSTEQTTPKGSLDIFDEPSPAATPPLSPGLLAPPPMFQTNLMALELPPHRRDTLEKIPRRARSQSWLVRTRHLLDDDKLVNRTPWIAHVLYGLSIFLLIITFPFCLPFCAKVAREYERVVMFRTGRLMKGTKGPGLYFVIPCIDTYKVVDLRVLSFDVPPQEILSRDSVTVSVEAVIYFRISNPIISVTNVNDAQFSTKLLAQTTLRNVLGTKTLSEILQERDNISSVTEKVLDEGTDPWGVKVQRVEIKDIRLPHQLTKAMATEAEATRDARAKIVSADGERNASRTLVEAADEIGKNRVALHLRFLQTMCKIAAERNHTIVVPVSVELVRGMAGKFGTFYKAADYSIYSKTK